MLKSILNKSAGHKDCNFIKRERETETEKQRDTDRETETDREMFSCEYCEISKNT